MIQEDIKQAIVKVIKTINTTGNVYDRIKYSSNWTNFKDQFLYHDPVSGHTGIRGWWITIPTLGPGETNHSFDMHWHNYIYPIHAVMVYSDKGDTEPDFNNMIWSVFETLHSQGVLGIGPGVRSDGAHVIDGSIDVDVPTVDLRFFGSTLCHYCEMRMTVSVGDPIIWQP